tara:strand:- start:916 stop:1197 length:282 start_codon:yes stop_codon:yes gene_type:complete
MKITKSQLKKLIKEEFKIISEQQSAEDLERQAELEKTANVAAAREKYGAAKAEIDPTLGKALGAEQRVGPGQVKMIDLLSDIKGLLQQLVQKP